MKSNCIILTGGITGSSVLTSLIARAGYWTGESTYKKADYETHENEELIKLNLRLFEEAKYNGNYTMKFSAEAIQQISSVFGKIDKQPYRSFLQKCDKHSPWIWKDPRLWLTIRFWKNLMDLNNIKFILMTRDHLQMWISATLRRQIQTYDYCKSYNESIKASIIDFFKENQLPYLHLTYEELVVQPRESIVKLNNHLNTGLDIEDLKKAYSKPLYKMPRSSANLLKAGLIYLKNYSERHR